MISILLALSLISPAAFGDGGNSVDNGGQYLSLKFTRMGFEVLSAMKKLGAGDVVLGKSDLAIFDEALASTRVDTVKGPILDNYGRQVDARFSIIYNRPVIEIDRLRWPAILADLNSAHRLVFHEYLRAMGINDDNYKVSIRLEQGLIKAILQGQTYINPSSASGQSVYDQLGDYFKLATFPTLSDITRGMLDSTYWNGVCFDSNGTRITSSIDIHKKVNGNGPLFPGVDYEIVSYFPISTAQFSQFVLMNNSLAVCSLNCTYVRTRNNMLFMEVILNSGQVNPPASTVPQFRCYFW